MNKYFVIDTNGKKHTRNSMRTYTHAVLRRDSKAAALRLAEHKDRFFADNFWYHHAFLDGTSKWLDRSPWETQEVYDKRVQKDIERSRYALRGCKTPDELWNITLAERLEGIEKRNFDAWGIEGWCGRHDLAVKLAHKTSCRQEVGETIILPVEIHTS
jgi:hypothetical protein